MNDVMQSAVVNRKNLPHTFNENHDKGELSVLNYNKLPD